MTQQCFLSAKLRRGSWLTLITFSLAFVVIALGAYTRLTDAGLSCPDWPNCYGYLTAPHTVDQLQGAANKYPAVPVDIKKAWTEMTHRYFAGTEGLLILLLVGSIFLTRKAKDAKTMAMGLALIGLLCVQVMLGMLTVTEKLRPVIVLSHLLTGISILSVLWWTYLDLNLKIDLFHKDASAAKLLPWLWLGFVVVAAQITLGGWVSTHYAGLACIDFPYCNGNLWPALHLDQFNSDLITIHMLHRFGAYTTAVVVTLIGLYLFRKPSFRANGVAMLALIAAQITLGILNLVWLRPVWIAMLHQAVAILLLLAFITALVKARVESRI